MLLDKPQKKIALLLLTASLSMTASCASIGSQSESPSPIQVIRAVLEGRSSETLTETERAEIRAAILESYPPFPPPSPEALAALRKLNDPYVNLWIQDLTILCRQLDKEC